MADTPTSPDSIPRLRVGVVGTAHWAREVHAAGAVAAQHADLVSVWGRTPERAQSLAQRYDVEAAASFEELLDRVDVVTFAVPPQVQPDLAAMAARAGRHLLLDKPVATSLRATDELAAAVREGGVQASVFFTRRFVPDFEKALQAAATQEWSGARVRWLADVAAADSPYRDSVWRAEPLAALWDLAPHVLAHLVPVLGAVESVTAERSGHGVELRTQHRRGAQADIAVSLHSPDYVEEFRLLRGDGSELVLDASPVDAVEPFARALDNLVRRAHGLDEPCPAPLEVGVEVTRVLAEAEASLCRSGPRSAEWRTTSSSASASTSRDRPRRPRPRPASR
ncbi:Gfo/Idh/MocA family protein [Nocardioides daphniae]|uniref:Oxidoreductase n=1 Tax=Nocardioides daphniae TaxID=402297 RepID=A0ABQ1QG01_9ACTN|nr:Gfo/Idh/MocA family oxidoreductase [Nocardioides daphniae]GGD25010.1 oxidoreductase [Nocardioides daphniae]